MTLPKGRTFCAKYARVPRFKLPDNVIMEENIKEEQHQKVKEENQ